MLQKSMHEASIGSQNLAHELTFYRFRPFFFVGLKGCLEMTKKKYEAPVLRKAGKLSSLVAGGASKTL